MAELHVNIEVDINKHPYIFPLIMRCIPSPLLEFRIFPG